MLFVTLLASCVIAGCAARRTWVLAPGQQPPPGCCSSGARRPPRAS